MGKGRLTCEIENADGFAARALEIARALDRGEDVEPQIHLSFPDMEALLAVLTPKRFTLLRTLRQIGPSSVRALAAAAGRDYKAVHGDVAALIAGGLIERQAPDRVAVEWDRIVTELDLAA